MESLTSEIQALHVGLTDAAPAAACAARPQAHLGGRGGEWLVHNCLAVPVDAHLIYRLPWVQGRQQGPAVAGQSRRVAAGRCPMRHARAQLRWGNAAGSAWAPVAAPLLPWTPHLDQGVEEGRVGDAVVAGGLQGLAGRRQRHTSRIFLGDCERAAAAAAAGMRDGHAQQRRSWLVAGGGCARKRPRLGLLTCRRRRGQQCQAEHQPSHCCHALCSTQNARGGSTALDTGTA